MFPDIKNDLKTLYDGLCTIQAVKDVEGDDFLMHKELVVILEDEPCRLSHGGSAPGVVQDNGATVVGTDITLILDNTIVVPEGCRITVTQDGRTDEYRRSGTPKIYCNHQSVPVELNKTKA